MKLSRFNLVTRAISEPSKGLLYNTLQDHRILFDDTQINIESLLHKISNKFILNDSELECAEQLKEIGIVLDDEVDEIKIFEQWYNDKIRYRNDLMQVTILPAMNCNLACHYCFENEVRQNGLMKPEIVEQTISYLHHKLKEVRPKNFHLVFFGGEPLLHPKAIEKITKEVSALCKNMAIEFEMGMVSNGVLLREEFVNELVPYGWKWIKITFDGDKDQHDHKRVKHDGKGTFDIIYDNLSRTAGKLKIAIGGNFDEQNYDSMYSLVKRLKKSPFGEQIFVARFKPIMKINSALATQREGKITASCEVSSFSKEQVKQIFDLKQHTAKVGLSIDERPDIGPCEFHQAYSMTIGPDGNIYKCPAFAGIKNLAAGHVSEVSFNQAGKDQITFEKWDEECSSCAYLPNCVGGCRFNSINRTGDIKTKSCEYNYLVTSTENYMQNHLKQMMAEENANSLSQNPPPSLTPSTEQRDSPQIQQLI